LAASVELRVKLKLVFDNLNVHPVLIGTMCAREFGEDLLTDNYNFLFSKEDYGKLKQDGHEYGIKVRVNIKLCKNNRHIFLRGTRSITFTKINNFKFDGWNVNVIKEGDPEVNGINPHPRAIEGAHGVCSIEGLVYLQLINYRQKGVGHIFRLMSRVDEQKLKAITGSQNNEKAWKVYQYFKRMTELSDKPLSEKLNGE